MEAAITGSVFWAGLVAAFIFAFGWKSIPSVLFFVVLWLVMLVAVTSPA